MVQNRMALDAQGSILPNPVWLVLGWLSRLTGLSVIATYHLGRALLALVWLRVLWALCLRFTPGPRTAMAAFLMASLGSGLQWMSALGIPVRTADWITELWTWPSILYYPHFAASLALAGGGILLYLRGAGRIDATGTSRDAGGAAGLLGLLVLVHPYTALTLFAAIALHAVIARIDRFWHPGSAGPVPGSGSASPLFSHGSTRRALIVLGAMTLPFLALAAQVAVSPAMANWVRENVMPSPPPLHYLMGLGLVGALAIAGIIRLAARRAFDTTTAFLVAWIACAAILAYGAPLVSVERRCIEGVHVAFALLAAGFIGPWLERRGRAAAAIAIAALALAIIPTNIVTAIGQSTTNTPGRVHDDWPDLFQTVRNLPGERTVMVNARAGMYLAAFSGATVFAGHDQLTPALPDRIASIDAFFGQPSTWAHRRDLLLGTGARWVIVDPRHPVPGDPFPPALLHAAARTWALYGPVDAESSPPETR
jgi:hypothetical protein